MKIANNYRVPGKKMTSRFGMSHREMRRMAKHFVSKFGPEQPEPRLKYNTKRLAKKCPHKAWEDESWAGPESGGMGGRCRHCGYSFHHTLY